jgi:hypothetical protein
VTSTGHVQAPWLAGWADVGFVGPVPVSMNTHRTLMKARYLESPIFQPNLVRILQHWLDLLQSPGTRHAQLLYGNKSEVHLPLYFREQDHFASAAAGGGGTCFMIGEKITSHSGRKKILNKIYYRYGTKKYIYIFPLGVAADGTKYTVHM